MAYYPYLFSLHAFLEYIQSNPEYLMQNKIHLVI